MKSHAEQLRLNDEHRAMQDPGAFLERLETVVMARNGRNVGGEIRFLCPAHDGHDPSADYNPTKHTWICRVCGAGGGALTWPGS